ncbi:hypothetical protein LC55x_2668 [Lysobacter capsici]|nr:hypothetical protein LC55x_2668 [Lysobacter capsici]
MRAALAGPRQTVMNIEIACSDQRCAIAVGSSGARMDCRVHPNSRKTA